ncbi:solute carrier family 2, facilitated glucose transporter member 9-like [Anomaloglossus baeobatrachus]|uniref:solute carrier family 2, facilitated glucose transporter member 9-like n=1 Tax=Anomaloglossus baeobatrachus TaxID=238106 RepID=UPI003F508834
MSSMSSELVQHRNLFLLIFVLGIGGTFQYGYHMSVLNSPSPFIKQFINDTLLRRHGTRITDGSLTLIWSLVVSIFSIGGLIGSTASGYLTGRFGKKKCQMCIAVLPLVSAVLMGLSQTVDRIEMIVAARFLSGFYSGLGINVHAQYVGETAPRKLRGFINATGPLFVTLGKLCGQIVGLKEIFGTESLWPQVLLCSGISSLVQLVALPFFPESPPYLLLVKGDKEGCLKALKQLWGDRDHQPVIDEMLKEQNTQKTGKRMGVLELLKDHSNRYQLLTMIGLILSLQLSGANAIYFYAYDVFHEAGFPEDQIPYVSLGVGAFEFVSAMICSLLIDRFGRRVLLLGGYSLMALTLGLLTVTLAMQEKFSWMPYCSVSLTFTFIFLYGAGPAGATISTCVEIFAQAPRVPAFVISGVFSWVGLYILGMIFPYIVETLQHFCFLLFLSVIIISGTVIYFFVPETKGKSIADISQEFNNLKFRRKRMKPKADGVLCSRL